MGRVLRRPALRSIAFLAVLARLSGQLPMLFMMSGVLSLNVSPQKSVKFLNGRRERCFEAG